MLHTVEIDLDGQKITLETGKIAKQANGAVVVRSGDTVVLVSACANEPTPRSFRSPSIIVNTLTPRVNFPAALSSARGALRRRKSSPAG
jgi:ribonuclease PH